MPLQKDRFGLIFLGASSFPKSKRFKSDAAFLEAKNRIEKSFDDGFRVLHSKNVLDLFDKEYTADDVDVLISAFIEDRKDKVDDLIIYYIGHGGFDGGAFVLTTKRTRDESIGVSSITAKNLGKTLSKVADDKRIFLILDCCFAGEMYNEIQSPVFEAIGKEVFDAFPDKGLALLCSSPKDEVSFIVKDRGVTMFSESFDVALRTGNPLIKREYLTLREVAQLTFSHIKSFNGSDIVRPEVHTPKMPVGDIADLPHFRNNAVKAVQVLNPAVNPVDKITRAKVVKKFMAFNELENVRTSLLDYVNDFEETSLPMSDGIQCCSEITELLAEESEAQKVNDENKKREFKKAISERRKNIYERIFTILNL